ncbi:hypothetical protein FH972_024130 [Carpinus fangiana]|uniref:KOW domain-containing protein n=1 Tax=Carpinus fangiana TaxID=176857 RepID=A0A5N6KXM3_9ROSI|nr:hypothetical protein FH972_024130 [Carpinus fangiana]
MAFCQAVCFEVSPALQRRSKTPQSTAKANQRFDTGQSSTNSNFRSRWVTQQVSARAQESVYSLSPRLDCDLAWHHTDGHLEATKPAFEHLQLTTIAVCLLPRLQKEGCYPSKHLPPHIPVRHPSAFLYQNSRTNIPTSVGDIVDVVANGAVQKGMPYKVYHGKTGVVYNVTKSAVGVIMHKRVGNEYLEKRINVRIEHVRASRSRDDFLRRVKENEKKRKEAKSTGKFISLKRNPLAPRGERTIDGKANKPESLAPIAYDTYI